MNPSARKWGWFAAGFRWFSLFVLFALIFGLIGMAIFAGFEIGKRQWFLHSILEKVDQRLEKAVIKVAPGQPAIFSLERRASHLIDLEAEVAKVPVRRVSPYHTIRENGGGLTSFGSDVLLLAYDGRIYAASSSEDVRSTEITVPDTNRAAYEALADDPSNTEYEIEAGYLRYNDLVKFSGPNGPSLAIAYTEYHPDRKCVTNTVALLPLGADVNSINDVQAAPSDWQVIYRTEPCLPLKTRHLAIEGHMAGGKLVFEAPSTLYMTSGDYHFDGMRSEVGPGIAQDPSADYGKILAIDVVSGDGRVVSMGHRNPQGLTLTPDGTLYTLEHGPKGGDELNVVRDGANYGWPLESYGLTYLGASAIPGSLSYGRHSHFERPIYSWVPSIAGSALTYVDGFHPSWDGDLLAAALLDGSLFRLRIAEGRVIYSERIEIGTRIRDVHQHNDGRIVLWTDDRAMVFLTGQDRQNRSEVFAISVQRQGLSSHEAKRLETAISACAECHSFEVGDNVRSPSLARIFGSEIASSDYDGYSDGLSAHEGAWTEETLTEFLQDPQSFAPGTPMPNPGFNDNQLIQSLVAYLKLVSESF
ncbi:Soluble aldose sugar dehydrogenase YliI precursor [Ruegeria atlantica]|uniref:Soluble aldose sugar dehydrogenase YliI n=2 Tax=Ruegeria atlantica TaxID=81569 RepID=A0A0P1E394_9RHOB|nr:Soluble aldose sugar dehydrogenase YliI precursor [Ruegeria atlantica]